MGCYSISIFITSLLALGLSAYSVYVVNRINEDDEYEALCDIGPQISCSKAFSSETAKGFGIDFLPEELKVANGFYGIGFYSILAILSFTKNTALVSLQLVLSVTSLIVSIYLAYISYFVLNNLCVVCVSTYALNVIGFVLIFKKLSQLRGQKAVKQD